MTAPVIRYSGGDERMDRSEYPIESTTEIKPGHFCSFEGGYLVLLNAATEDASFAGIAATGHKPTVDNLDHITVLETCEVEVDVVSGTYTRGEGLKLNGVTSGDSIILEADAGANTLAWAAETKASTTRLRVRVAVWDLQKLIGSVDA